MPEPEPLSVDDALDRLVNQFSDAMAFFRELIQNALDAGSREVEVWFEHRADDKLMVIHVDDWGDGMSREIIESRLTRLFSSSKDGDLTKIGKFGIGFVSVFAIEPQAVSIDTSRDGEYWRVVFDDKRRFSLIRLEQPVEGTKIEIYKRASKAEFADFRARAIEVVRYWCKHVDGEVRVEGELVTEAFDLDLPCKVRYEQPEEIIVIGHPRDGVAFAGFYNRGLTLVEEPMIPGIAFKASSTKLEHTLTRDDVIREAGFTRLMDRVDELIANELCAEVFIQLDKAVRALDVAGQADGEQELEREQIEWLEYLWAAAAHHERAPHPVVELDGQVVARSPSGALIERRILLQRSARDPAILAPERSPLTDVLERDGRTVVWMPDAWTKGHLYITALPYPTLPVEMFCTALPPRDSDEAVRWQILATAVAVLLEDWGAKTNGVRLGHLDYPGSAVAERVAITQAEFGEATAMTSVDELGTRLLSSRRVVVLNADHPTIRTIAALAQTEPELAAYFAVKAFFLGTRLDAETAEKLAVATHDRRVLRRGVGR